MLNMFSIVFGKAYVNGALSMITSISNNTVCSSLKWLQNKWNTSDWKTSGCKK